MVAKMRNRMKIAIDCRWISIDTGGIKQYTSNLIKSLALIDENNEYFLIYNDPKTKTLLEANINNKQNFKFLFLKYGIFSLFNQLKLPGKLKKLKISVFHSPGFMFPLFLNNELKLVVTIHDLIPYLHPEMCFKSKVVIFRSIYKKIMYLSAKKAGAIITDSNYSQNDILSVFPFSLNKIKVIPIGFNDVYKVINNDSLKEAIKEKYGIRKKFLFYLGRQDPSKNLSRLIMAFAKVKNKDNYQLVIAGKKDNRYPQPYTLVERLGLQDSVSFTGPVPFEDLPLLYNAAELFVFPSLYEGFGLPPLEAMACGCPVVSSNTASLPEVVGEAGALVNPYSVEELSTAMEKVLEDVNLRQTLIAKGLERVKLFSWEKAARQTLEVYEKARLPSP
ncbi:MAG: glycosyltransferase family 1 protein [Elusimicrobiota bacterium]